MSQDKEHAHIPEALLRKFNAKIAKLSKGEIIFRQGESASAFMMVKIGRVRMSTVNEQGKEFVQGYFEVGQSFGEPPFFTRTSYPASAVAMTDCEIWKIGRRDFLRLLKEDFNVHLAITESLSGRLEYKSMMLSELAVEEAEHRILTLLSYFREQEGRKDEPFHVPFSRQQLADLSGLRVVTVIRTVKAMEQKDLVSIDAAGKIVMR
ncbi:MAG: Crp/Fnr family transcriptional regulator [Bacteroidota bacterium]